MPLMEPSTDTPDRGETMTASRLGLSGQPGATGSLPAMLAATLTHTPTVLSFGEYEVIEELGEGGMGRVYKALDRTLNRFVAVKVLRSHDPFEMSRFRHEAEMIAQLRHTNIVEIFAVDHATDGRPYLVLEFAEGGSLDRILAGTPQEPRRAAEALETLARAVQYAHEKGVIHRDLKPHNILRTKDGTLKLTDFGLAKELEVSSGMTPSGAVMGTPSYMAPEQAEGKLRDIGPATDVYGLGAILYEMLTGRPPFRGINMVDTLEQVRWAEPAPPSRLVPRIHRDLSTICLKCLQKAQGRRYATAKGLADDLRHWLNGETINARPAPRWERLWRHVRKRPWQTAAVTAAGLLAALLVLSGLYLRDLTKDETAKRLIDVEHQLRRKEHDEAQAITLEVEQKNRAILRVRSEKALDALDGIRDMILKGDLRNLKDLGPLKSKLVVYYKNLNGQLKADEGYDKTKLARSWSELGDLIHETGTKEDALEAYTAARDLYLGVGTLDTLESRVVRAELELKCGRLAFELNSKDGKVAKACDAAEDLLKDVSLAANPKCAGVLAETWHLRGQLFDNDRLNHDAVDAYDRAIGYRKTALADDLNKTPKELAELQKRSPEAFRETIENLRGLARGYGYKGDVLMDGHNLTGADKTYWEAHRIREKVLSAMELVVQQDKSHQNERELSIAQSQFGRGDANIAALQTYNRALGTAKHFALRALDYRKKLSEANPNNIEFRSDVCSTSNLVAGLKLLLDKRDGVEELLAESRKVPKDVSDAKGGYSSNTLGTLALSHLLLAQFHADGNPDKAGKELEAARKLLDTLAVNNGADPGTAFNRAAAYALSAQLDPAAADAYRTTALEAFEQALKNRYRDKHPEDIRRMRAFQTLKGNPRFEESLGKLLDARSPAATSR